MKEFFKSLNLGEEFDIAESVNGYYYFLRYDNYSKCYDSIIKFQTEDELKKILVEEMALDMSIAIEATADEYTYGNSNCEYASTEQTYPENVEELCAHLEKISKILSRLDGFGEMIKKLV